MLAELGLGRLWPRLCSKPVVCKGETYAISCLLLPWMLPGLLLLVVQGASAAILALQGGGTWSLLSCLVWGLSFGTGDPSEW